ncbi:hypothetical protein RhiJN_25809 [Ceratobasidium sp. AG-Ba]|nr:hypothetical protein RhiJN_25809 [Ceratobasidium sp. AG-Ba]
MPGKSNTARVKTLADLSQTGRNTAYRVLEGIANSEGMLIVCGSGISVAAGIPSFSNVNDRSALIPSTNIKWGDFLSLCAKDNLTAAQLKTVNKVMTHFRIQARQAEPTPFHRFLQAALDMALKSIDVYSLVDELACRVKLNNGTVILIDPQDCSRSPVSNLIDYHLRLDAQQCGEILLSIIKNGARESQEEIWAELAEPGLREGRYDPPAGDQRVRCDQCGFSLEGTLATCIHCGVSYCYENPSQPMGSMCLALNAMDPSKASLPPEYVVGAFECYECFDHSTDELYPHLMRARRVVHTIPEEAKRLVFIVYYLSQFWPDAENTITAVQNSWGLQYWECIYHAIPLQSRQAAFAGDVTPPWPAGTYQVFVVYITHGLSGHTYQIDDQLKATPFEFLDETLRSARTILQGAQKSVGMMLACGDVYLDAEKVLDIQRWIDE